MKWLEYALTILLVAIVIMVIMVIASLVAGCARVDPDKPEKATNTPYVQPEAAMELVGCVDGTCTYTFYRSRRCFLTIGQANQRNDDSWMFDLECPG